VETVTERRHNFEGKIHCIQLPDTYYSPHAESRLRTIPIYHKTRNVGVITTSAGIGEYLYKCEKYNNAHQVVAFPKKKEKDVALSVVNDDQEELDDQNTKSIKTIQT
jgi:hypothetical protein